MGLFDSIGKIAKSVVGSVTGGDVLGFAGGLIGGQMQNEASANSAAAANAFTEEQLKNRHQWEVADLKKAGLNPVLSAKFGGSIGGSAMANVPSNPIGDAINSARQGALMREQIKNVEADTRKKQSEADTNDNLGALYAQQFRLARAMNPFLVSSARSNAIQDLADEAIIRTPWGIRLKALDYFGRSLNPFTSSAKDIKPSSVSNFTYNR